MESAVSWGTSHLRRRGCVSRFLFVEFFSQSQVLFWCYVLFVRLACAQPPPSYPGCQRLFMRGFRFRSSLNHDPREKVKDETKNQFVQIIWELNLQRLDTDVSVPDSVWREGWPYISYVYSHFVVRGLGQTIDFLEALRFSFPVPVVGPRARDELSLSCSLLPQKR